MGTDWVRGIREKDERTKRCRYDKDIHEQGRQVQLQVRQAHIGAEGRKQSKKTKVGGIRYRTRCSGAIISRLESTTAWAAISFPNASTRYMFLQLSGLGRAMRANIVRARRTTMSISSGLGHLAAPINGPSEDSRPRVKYAPVAPH